MKKPNQRLKRFSLFLIVIFILPVGNCWADAGNWREMKGDHFIVRYRKTDESLADKVLSKAEEYYKRIADQLGYPRYSNFWTWNDRVHIIIYPNQQSFHEETRQPEWSKGYASRHSELFESKVIVTYRQEEDFLEGLLPHEISHLILRDMIGFDHSIPIWFDEGVAQLQESHQDIMKRIMRYLVENNQYIPFDVFREINIGVETDTRKVMIFYAQSYCVVDYLLNVEGREAFVMMCRGLKNGKDFWEALRSAYFPHFESWKDLQDKWVQFMVKP